MRGPAPGTKLADMARSTRPLPLLAGPLTALALLVPGVPAAAPAPAPTPTISLWPKTVPRGAVLLVTGRHWTPGRLVDVLVGPPRSEADHVAWARARADGTFRRGIRIARDAKTGSFVVLGCRRACRVKAQASFRVVRAGR
jgi:hypothetical protein